MVGASLWIRTATSVSPRLLLAPLFRSPVPQDVRGSARGPVLESGRVVRAERHDNVWTSARGPVHQWGQRDRPDV